MLLDRQQCWSSLETALSTLVAHVLQAAKAYDRAVKLSGGAVHQLNFPFSPELEALTDTIKADAASEVPPAVLSTLQDISQRAAASQPSQVSCREAAAKLRCPAGPEEGHLHMICRDCLPPVLPKALLPTPITRSAKEICPCIPWRRIAWHCRDLVLGREIRRDHQGS